MLLRRKSNMMDKVSINILGCCVTRDSIENNKDHYNVGRYCAFVSPYTMFDGKSFEVAPELLQNEGAHGFAQRVISLDATKGTFELIASVPSEWLLLDFADIRMGVIEWPDSGVTLTYNSYVMKYLNSIKMMLRDNNIVIRQVDELSENILFLRLEKLLDKLLTIYRSDRIILNEFYNTFEYINDNDIFVKFSDISIAKSKKYNNLIRKAYELCEKKLTGCHIVECPDNLVAVSKHKWGLDPLHYHSLYYQYAEKAFSVITQKNDKFIETEMLENLRQLYSEKFSVLREKAINNGIRANRNKWQAYSTSFKSLILSNQLSIDKHFMFSIQNNLIEKGYKHIYLW